MPDEKDHPAAPPEPAPEPAAPELTEPLAPDQDATVAVTADPGAAAPAVEAPSSPVFPEAAPDAPVAADGIDALDDPYFSPAVPADLTEAQALVAIPSPVESLPERRRRMPRWAIALLVVAALAAAGGVAWLTYEQELWGGRTVPDVVGLDRDEATGELEALGFTVDVELRGADDGFGIVLDCTPGEGVRADPSSGVTLVVAAERTVPSVVGLSVEEATSALHDAGAQDVSVEFRNSDEAAGTVLAVDPAEGEAFVSTDAITLTVAQAYAVPNVEGAPVEEALETLEGAGLSGHVTYVDPVGERGVVISCDPGVGERVEAGATVELSVSSPYPSSVRALLEYFEVRPADLASFLADEGFTLRSGGVYAGSGNAHAAYVGPGGDVVQISDAPERGGGEVSSSADVLADGAGVGGVRYAFASSSVPSGGTSETEDGVRAVMKACGLTGLSDTCTQDDVRLPEGADAEGVHFVCGSGTQGDYTWAVLIGGREGATRVVALAAPTSHFSSVDLASYGGGVCDYVAVTNLFAR